MIIIQWPVFFEVFAIGIVIDLSLLPIDAISFCVKKFLFTIQRIIWRPKTRFDLSS